MLHPREQQGGDGQLKHGITQEFQTLVVLRAKTAMRHGALDQAPVGKMVLQPLLQLPKGICGHQLFDGILKPVNEIGRPEQGNLALVFEGSHHLVIALGDLQGLA